MSSSRLHSSSAAAAATTHIFAPRRPAGAPAAPHTLVVDGDVSTGARLGRWLHRHGHAVALACSVDAAEVMLSARSFDLVVADPAQVDGGHRWLDRLCAREARPAVILTPGHPTLQSSAQAALLPLAGYLPKPVDHHALQALLRQLLGPGHA